MQFLSVEGLRSFQSIRAKQRSKLGTAGQEQRERTEARQAVKRMKSRKKACLRAQNQHSYHWLIISGNILFKRNTFTVSVCNLDTEVPSRKEASLKVIGYDR